MKKILFLTMAVWLLCSGAAWAQEKMAVQVSVTDLSGGPLPGATVVEAGTNNSATADVNGKCTISVPVNATLEVSFMGYATQQVTATRAVIEVQLEEDGVALDEIVVTALGIKREEKSLGYVTQKVVGDGLQTVKGTSVVTSLTGKVAGLQILNTTEFMRNSNITIRGATPILVIDGVPANNLNINDINSDDIESIDVLKGATASALYGSRGGSGAIVVTTKRSDNRKFNISINTSNMFHSGFLAIPEAQGSYAAGWNGVYQDLSVLDDIWGPKLDAGVMAIQWDPELKQRREFELKSLGKDNFKNFLEAGYISNTSISVSQQGENGSFRSSASYMRQQHPYPNALGHQFGYTVSGEMKLGKKVTVNGSAGFSKRWADNIAGIGYNDQGYIYTLLLWTGPEYDIRKYRDYWVTPHEKQNWLYGGWYDNPYLSAYEKTEAIDNNKLNAMFSLNYEITDWLKLMVRSGYDSYTNGTEKRAPKGINSTRYWGGTSQGYFQDYTETGFSTNNDILLMANRRFSKFGVDVLLGGSLFYEQDKSLYATSRGGLVIPGFYSLANSAEAPTVSPGFWRKGVNSVYGKVTLDYDNKIFVDVTGRNDWSSTLPSDENSYFYPSVAASVLPSELITLPEWLSFWKLRGSWTISKQDLAVYAINSDYSTASNVWDGMNTAVYPATIRGNVKPITDRTFEIGTALNFLKSRIKFDFTYYNKHTYNLTREATVSQLSGFTNTLMNIDEEYERRGFEFMLEGTPIEMQDLKWTVQTNWATSKRYYKKLDEEYSAVNPWVKVGNRTDYRTYTAIARDPEGNMIHNNSNGLVMNPYSSLFGYNDPDWIWGLSSKLTWKRFTLNIAFDGRIGGLEYATTEYHMWRNGAHPDLDNQWRYQEVVEGKKNYPGGGVYVVSGNVTYSDNYGTVESDTRVYAPNTKEGSYQTYMRDYHSRDEFNIYDETFLKLRELSITYDIPQHIIQKVGASSASVSLIGQNLFLWSKEFRFTDPDVSTDNIASPSVRYLGFNVKLNF